MNFTASYQVWHEMLVSLMKYSSCSRCVWCNSEHLYTLHGRTCLARTLSSFSLLSSFRRATSCFAFSRTGGGKRKEEERWGGEGGEGRSEEEEGRRRKRRDRKGEGEGEERGEMRGRNRKVYFSSLLAPWSFPSLSTYWKSFKVCMENRFSLHCWATRSEPDLMRYSKTIRDWCVCVCVEVGTVIMIGVWWRKEQLSWLVCDGGRNSYHDWCVMEGGEREGGRGEGEKHNGKGSRKWVTLLKEEEAGS